MRNTNPNRLVTQLVTRARSARQLLILGGLLCIPAAIGVGVYAYGWADADALRSAPICQTPNRDSSMCMSIFPGRILARHPGGSKALASVTVEAAGTSTNVSWLCVLSGGACDGTSFEAGEDVSTGWWKGGLVALGMPGAVPRVDTDASPEAHLGIEAYLLALAIPALSLLLAALLHRRSTTPIKALLEDAVAITPQPPRPVDRGLVQRVFWSNQVWGLPGTWAILSIFPLYIVSEGFVNARLAPLVLIGTFVVAVALVAWYANDYYAGLIRTAPRRSIEVRRVELVTGRDRSQRTVITYDRLDGRAGTYPLDPRWNGHIKVGDRLDAFTSAKSGSISYMLSTPPAQV